MKTYLVRGVPKSLQTEGWWMQDTPVHRPAPTRRGGDDAARVALLGALIALADALIWQVAEPGLSLAVFFLALVAAAGLATETGSSRILQALGITAVAVAPLVELVQPLSVLLAGLGTAGALTRLALPACVEERFLVPALRLFALVPWQTAKDAVHAVKAVQADGDLGGRATRFALHWTLPLGSGLVFLVLLMGANPVLEDWVARAVSASPGEPDFGRWFFWLAFAIILWPLLALHRIRGPLFRSHVRLPRKAALRRGLVNAGSVSRSLVLFNLIFAVQTGLDTAILTGGAELPEGMSWARYAHRGAYPLLAAALLAGLFALLARPFANESREVKALLLLWLLQTVVLVLSSLFRLDAYVDVYGLTRLRVAALIWMWTVAVGLGMIAWQVATRRGNGWLMARLSGLGIGVLYVSAFVNVSGLVAGHNLTHPVPFDPHYICRLGVGADPAIAAWEETEDRSLCFDGYRPRLMPASDWREWGFRHWRVMRSVEAITAEAAR